MELTVLAVPGCPNLALLLHRLDRVLPDAHDAAPVSVRVITSEAEAAHFGMHGSPTLLIDGQGPFATPGAATSVSCRIHRVADGRTEGAPSIDQLKDALQRAQHPGR